MTERYRTDIPFLIYDGECPFCTSYAKFASLSRAFPGLELISAREQRKEVAEAWLAGIDLNRDMVLRVEGKWYAGEQAIQRLAESAHNNQFRNMVLRKLFRPNRYGRGLYEVLVKLRLMYLRLSNRTPLLR
jgi:predicted DCC family thiol-disulfide oxidoreductase YuxK